MYQPENDDFDLRIYVKSKDMYEYEVLTQTKVCAEGFWKGRHFVIGKNTLNYPVVYVRWFDEEPPGDEYFGEAYWLPEDQRGMEKYYGWDHGHYGDYSPRDVAVYGNEPKGHKWSIAEMLMEIAEFITWNQAHGLA